MKTEKGPQQNSAGQQVDGYPPPHACCANPRLIWTPTGLVEPLIACTHCGFRIDPDGLLLDWLDPEEIQAAQAIKENTSRILELAARLGLNHSMDRSKNEMNQHDRLPVGQAKRQALFSLGQVVATPGALAALAGDARSAARSLAA